jgi:hypothetical protein
MACAPGDLVLIVDWVCPMVWEYLSSNVLGSETPYLLYNDTTNLDALVPLFRRFVCVGIPKKWLEDKTSIKNVVFVNTEQLTGKGNLDKYNMEASYPGVQEIWDYSATNISISGKGRLVRCLPSLQEIFILQTLLKTVPKRYDVVIVNTMYGRRLELANELEKRGWSVLKLNGSFQQERDAKIASARVLINWHANEDWTVYEELRCERWRIAGMPIITETCANLFLPRELIVVKNADEVHRALRSLL